MHSIMYFLIFSLRTTLHVLTRYCAITHPSDSRHDHDNNTKGSCCFNSHDTSYNRNVRKGEGRTHKTQTKGRPLAHTSPFAPSAIFAAKTMYMGSPQFGQSVKGSSRKISRSLGFGAPSYPGSVSVLFFQASLISRLSHSRILSASCSSLSAFAAIYLG